MNKKFYLQMIIIVYCAFCSTAYCELIFQENFESTQHDWLIDDGNVWQIGETSNVGPQKCYENQKCLATVLGDNYPPNSSKKQAISPPINLPETSDQNEIHLRYWQWFSYNSAGYGHIQIQIYNDSTGEWSEWNTIDQSVSDDYRSKVWLRKDIDLSEYELKTIKIAFLHNGYSNYVDSGWYIDNIQITITTNELLGDFEKGWGDWSSDDGIWDVGTPSELGPNICHSGEKCSGTVLFDNYPESADKSRLISPSIDLESLSSANEEIFLKYWQWFSYNSAGYGYIQIKKYNRITKEWSEWENIDLSVSDDYDSNIWLFKQIDLTKYASQKIKIGFLHYGYSNYVAPGWYIDDVQVEKKTPAFDGDFETGWGGWYSDDGIWDVGTPSEQGPLSCHSGSKCTGTVLFDNYPPNADQSRLVSPSINLPDKIDNDIIQLQFWQWFSYNSGGKRQIQIMVYNKVSKEWYDWETIYSDTTSDSNGWVLEKIDITQYARKKIRIAFFHSGYSTYLAPGWYIDDVQMTLSGTPIQNQSKLPIVKELNIFPVNVFKNGKLSIDAKIVIE
jgi:hypothetical protein